MAVRRWGLGPDPGTGIVDREQMVQAILDGEAILSRAGGVLTVVVQRAETDLPGERVTVAAVFEWKDRTDARPQPESPGPQIASQVIPEPEAVEPEPEVEEDGLDRTELPEEDTSSIPAGAL